MYGENIILGHEAKIRINDEVFAVVGGEARLTAQEHDTSDTEGDGWEDGRAGLKRLEVNLEAQFPLASEMNPFQDPLNLDAGEVIDLKIYPYGIDSNVTDNFYWATFFLLLESVHGFAVRAPQPFRVRGRSKRAIYRPFNHP